jgi:hypothetical protein
MKMEVGSRVGLAARAAGLAFLLMVTVGALQSASAARPQPNATIELVTTFDFSFTPGVASGWILGPVSEIGPYLVEVSPLEPPGVNGGFFTSQVQQEFFNGSWIDVVRIQLLPGGTGNNVLANVRVFRLGSK